MFYTTSLSGGGGERVWAVLASALARRGHTVTLVVDFDAEENRPFVAPEVEVMVLGGGHLRSLWRLMRLIAARRPDVVLSAIGGSDLKAAFATLVLGLLGERPRPVIGTFHGYRENETGILGDLHFRLAPLLTRLCDRTVCVSDGLRREVIERWHAAADRCVRVYNPIRVEGCDPTLNAAALAARAPIILAAGRLVPVKGFVRLVRAFARLPHPDARLVILGHGPEHDAIRAEAERLGVADRLDLPGYVAEPWQWYARARCFALSSRVEAFGNVVVEALAHGLPVVATDCDGPREILIDPAHGALVPRGDEAAFAAALTAALAAPGDPAPRAARAAEFDVATSVARYESLIESVLAAPVRPGAVVDDLGPDLPVPPVAPVVDRDTLPRR